MAENEAIKARSSMGNLKRSLTMSLYFIGLCTASWFICTTKRRKEWADIMLDYVHHKRCSFLSNSWEHFLRRLKS
ncbi:hypothetical protein, conserved in Apicomplexan species [Plasmodium knowlesi strain H]|uniref:Transmembrane protein n=3 Tax=Plasmodium knowlesi TaxID=5850 RepID=A0A5K1V3M4_PLAKH|nr:uncharacterized protein PKNH_1233200 [Plasmodium knowlesi strain H]OTN65257.1 Uncharacterized protein PKNOH_S110104100 [Plasmodium knowlesi]CAA9989660.1 conserved protein, unknown function [Plasmodium knowlesi strain H]SBO22779.1 hypothetical protein, conserved in Apicomplexan species [Plasmodium knowlesi strain H]SBO23123.1 hypothetical protein, conserved in Apicomplexan species [Plasmodium knowlesi strain H]VVS79134.1 conserved protein, unknown function [Plasmodium knowlesi strain H]|eukprot:XP_002260384.1 [Plasmodium knowlesi strain H]